MKLEPTFKNRCESIAVNWRHRLNLHAFDRMPAQLLLNVHDAQARPPDEIEELSPALKAWFLTNPTRWSAAVYKRTPLLIIYNPTHSAARYESDLMHEFGHILLRHPMSQFDPETGRFLRNPRHEDEATYLGSCLQIPRLGLQWAAAQQYQLSDIAQHFGASEEMVRFRINMTGIKIAS